MFITNNPFAQLNTEMPNFFTPELMKGYVMLMVLFVIGGVLFDIWHKKSAKYFFEHSKNQEKHAKRKVSSSEKTSMMVETLTKEVLTSGEFSNPQRRLSHLLSMYGFIIFLVTTVILIFAYPTAADGSAGCSRAGSAAGATGSPAGGSAGSTAGSPAGAATRRLSAGTATGSPAGGSAGGPAGGPAGRSADCAAGRCAAGASAGSPAGGPAVGAAAR